MPNFEFAAKNKTSGPISSTSFSTGLSCFFFADMTSSISEPYHGARKIARGEWCEIIHTFADTDKVHRQSESCGNGYKDSTARGAVELGHHQAGDPGGLAENLHLAERVLTHGGIENEKHGMRRG